MDKELKDKDIEQVNGGVAGPIELISTIDYRDTYQPDLTKLANLEARTPQVPRAQKDDK